SPERQIGSLTTLARQTVELQDNLLAIKQRYLAWQTERLSHLLEDLVRRPQLPDIVAFPECSIPFECLPLLKQYSRDSGITFFAGTHSPLTTTHAAAVYKKSLQVAGATVRNLLQRDSPPPAVLPILEPDRGFLIPKTFASIFERSDTS